MLFVVGFRRLFRVTSGMHGVRPRHVGMVSRFLVVAGLVVLRCFTMMVRCVGMMFLGFLMVFGSFLRHLAFPEKCPTLSSHGLMKVI